MKKKPHHTVRTVPNFNRIIMEIGRIDTSNTQIKIAHFFCLGTDMSIESGRVKLDVWAQTLSLGEMTHS
jgi:hypothetical protein